MSLDKHPVDFSIARPEDEKEIIQLLLKGFLIDESMNAALRPSHEEFLHFIENLIPQCLSRPLSIIAKDGDQIVGVILNDIWHRSEEKHSPSSFSNIPRPMEIIDRFLTVFSNAFWDLIPQNINTVLHREIMNVAKSHQRKGITKRLMEYPIANLADYGIQGFAVKVSSLANQRLLQKLNYQTLIEIPFASICGEDGLPLVKPLDGTTSNLLMWKKLEEFEFSP